MTDFKPNNIKLSGPWGNAESVQRGPKNSGMGKRRVACSECLTVVKNAAAFRYHKRDVCPNAKGEYLR